MKSVSLLDLCGETCPNNYVRTVLALEDLEVGEVLEVILDGQEAIANVPRSVKQSGQRIVRVQREGNERLRLWIEKVQ